jgi:hypothetical protein
MDWRTVFVDILAYNKDYDLLFFNPATDDELRGIKLNTGVTVSGDLLDLLKQTNGIKNKCFGDFVVFNSDRIVEAHRLHIDFLKQADITPLRQYLFFADNGCGEGFGFEVYNGQIISNQIGVYYPIGNEFKIVAPDFLTWANEWYSGRLST